MRVIGCVGRATNGCNANPHHLECWRSGCAFRCSLGKPIRLSGFLGFGDTLVAVPWEAFTVQRTEGRDEYNLVLNATEEQIKGATGFDKDNWPDFADRQLAQDLDAHYGIERPRPRRAKVEARVGREGVDVQVEPRRRDRDR